MSTAWSKLVGVFQPSDRVKRWIRKAKEKRRNTYYEGPSAPRRIREEVLVFAAMHPTANVMDWIEFSSNLSTHSYQDGFTRGYEWLERGWDHTPDPEGEQLAEMEATDWSLAEANPSVASMMETGHFPDDPLAGVPEDKREDFLRLLDQINASPFTFQFKTKDD